MKSNEDLSPSHADSFALSDDDDEAEAVAALPSSTIKCNKIASILWSFYIHKTILFVVNLLLNTLLCYVPLNGGVCIKVIWTFIYLT